MSLLLSVESADFTFLKEKTKSTAGNLSVQLDKLSQAGYITVEKSFKGINCMSRKVAEERLKFWKEKHTSNSGFPDASRCIFTSCTRSSNC